MIGSGFLNEACDGEDFSVGAIGCDDGDLSLACDETSCEGVADVTTLGGGVAGGGEALSRGYVGGICAEGEDGAVAEVDECIVDAEGGQQLSQAFEGIAFEDAGEVEDDVWLVEQQRAAASGRRGDKLYVVDESRCEVGAVHGDVKEAPGLVIGTQTAGEEGEKGC